MQPGCVLDIYWFKMGKRLKTTRITGMLYQTVKLPRNFPVQDFPLLLHFNPKEVNSLELVRLLLYINL